MSFLTVGVLEIQRPEASLHAYKIPHLLCFPSLLINHISLFHLFPSNLTQPLDPLPQTFNNMFLSTSISLLSLMAITASAAPADTKKPTSSMDYGRGFPRGWASASDYLIQDNQNNQRALTGQFEGVSLPFLFPTSFSLSLSLSPR
jgi:hypothetical protein